MAVYYAHIEDNPLYVLAHHGVKGQKKGIRQWQYKDGSLTPAGRIHYGYGSGRKIQSEKQKYEDISNKWDDKTDSAYDQFEIDLSNGHSIEEANERLNRVFEEYKDLPIDKLPRIEDIGKHSVEASDVFKVSCAALSIVGLPYVGSKLAKTAYANLKQELYLDHRNRNGTIDSVTGLYLKDDDLGEDADLKTVNMRYKTFDAGAHNNCAVCSIAYDLRRRGYDVLAGTAYGLGSEDQLALYKNAKVYSVGDPVSAANSGVVKNENEFNSYAKECQNRAKKYLDNAPSNSRGMINVLWRAGGWHAMIYEIDKNGKHRIVCPQSGNVYSGKKLDKLLNSSIIAAEFIRTDNLEFNFDMLKKYKGLVV